jgi:hypothetical protein
MKTGPVRYGVSVALLATVLFVSGCSADKPKEPSATATSETPEPAYDGSQEPAATVLALVPDEARTLTVTDFDRVRAELGMDDLSDGSTPEELAQFWQRAVAERPLLTDGLLRPDEQQLANRYGFTQIDVAWEAHFFGADDHELGWVLRFRDDTDMSKVGAAVTDGSGPLAGSLIAPDERLVSSGATTDPAQSWAADPEIVAQVGLPANATYVARDCTPSSEGEGGTADLDDLGTWSVQFQGSLATAWLGAGRQDLFTRMHLGEDEPAFAEAFEGGVADPRTGRIGYVMTAPAAAAKLALDRQLPFATCA